jgi:AcrR family transcriptional regulator
MLENEGYDVEEKVPDVREALILAGIQEIEEHGPADFSLRRVANACGVSCAAPYKHFKNKEALIGAIVAYIDEKWKLLEHHILTVFPHRDAECLIELCLAGIRFWIGNPHFRSVHMMDHVIEGRVRLKSSLGDAAEAILKELAEASGVSPEVHAEVLYTVRSLVSGAILMLEDATLANTPATFSMLRRVLRREINF